MPKKAAPTHGMISLTRVGLSAGLRLRIWRISSTPLAFLRGDGRSELAGRAARGNDPAATQDLAHVVEHDHAVAQQAPPLLRMDGDSVGGVAVRAVSRRARGVVWIHCTPLVWAADVLGLVDLQRRYEPAFAVGVTRWCPCWWNLSQPASGHDSAARDRLHVARGISLRRARATGPQARRVSVVALG